jgi:Fe-S cluster assembly protein SufD
VASADASVDVAKVEDKWIAGSLERCGAGAGLDALRPDAIVSLAQARVPNSRVEDYRFTDLAALVTTKPVAADAAAGDAVDAAAWTLSAADATRVVLVDGVYKPDKSNVSGATGGVTVSTISQGASSEVIGAVASMRGGVFANINAATASDAVVINVPAGAAVGTPIHVVQLSTSAASKDGEMSSSAPRVAVHVGAGASVSIVEEFAAAGGSEDGAYWANGVCEVALEKGAKVTHTMVQAQTRASVHTRATHVTQAEDSEYKLAEINVGGKLGRHDLGVTQLGPRTNTELACFNLAGSGQCMDLHSKVTLDHEEGTTDQVHKCIVSSASGRGVFDGNVQVNRLAQRTDAGQISRNLLLVPKATVNVKPNLQIVADDVVCTHGCTVSDLEEEGLFYLQSRGLSPAIARSLLVAGFGLEIVSKVEHDDLKARVGDLVRSSLDRDDVVLVA